MWMEVEGGGLINADSLQQIYTYEDANTNTWRIAAISATGSVMLALKTGYATQADAQADLEKFVKAAGCVKL